MDLPDALDASPPTRRTSREGRIDNPLVRAVGRAPVTVRTKLVVAFAGIAVAPRRVRSPRAARARPVECPGRDPRDAAAARRDIPEPPDAGTPAATTAGATRRAGSGPATSTSRAAPPTPSETAAGHWSTRRSPPPWRSSGPASNEARFGFVPPAEDEALLVRIRSDFRRFSQTLRQIIALDRADAGRSKVRPHLATVIASTTTSAP